MKKKVVLKHALTFTLFALFSINLSACNDRIIEDGFDGSYGHINVWNEFHTALRTTMEKNTTKNIEVFYGNGRILQTSILGDSIRFDPNQNVELKLYRRVYASNLDAGKGNATKEKMIFFTRKTLEYFFSEAFTLDKNSNNFIKDTIEAADLVKDYKEYGVIDYSFIISPIENEPLELYRTSVTDPNEITSIYYGDEIRSYFTCSIHYLIDRENRIKFIESEKIDYENINY